MDGDPSRKKEEGGEKEIAERTYPPPGGYVVGMGGSWGVQRTNPVEEGDRGEDPVKQ